jgi:hypothetical protein
MTIDYARFEVTMMSSCMIGAMTYADENTGVGPEVQRQHAPKGTGDADGDVAGFFDGLWHGLSGADSGRRAPAR